MMYNPTSGRLGFQKSEPAETPPKVRSFMMHPTSGKFYGSEAAAPVPTAPRMMHFSSGRIGFAVATPDMKAEEKPTSGTVHKGVFCDCCQANNINGVRYKCSVCPDFDLCGSCVEANERNPEQRIHPRDHLFLRIAEPVNSNHYRTPGYLLNRSTWVHTGLSCGGCRSSPIVGYRYFCTACAESYCESCEVLGKACGSAGDAQQHNKLKMLPTKK